MTGPRAARMRHGRTRLLLARECQAADAPECATRQFAHPSNRCVLFRQAERRESRQWASKMGRFRRRTFQAHWQLLRSGIQAPNDRNWRKAAGARLAELTGRGSISASAPGRRWRQRRLVARCWAEIAGIGRQWRRVRRARPLLGPMRRTGTRIAFGLKSSACDVMAPRRLLTGA